MSMNVPARWRHLLGAAALCTLVSACQAWSPFGHKEQPDLRPFDTPLPVNTQPKRMAIGNRFVVAVKADGTVWSWGSAHEGELGTGDTRHYQPKQLPELSDVIEVTAGFNHVIALKRDGTVWGWGSNQYGQAIGEGPAKVERPTKIKGVSGIKRVAATANGVVFLNGKGELFGMGENDGNPFNLPDKVLRSPVRFAVVEDAAALFAGVTCVGVVSKDGRLQSWGEFQQKHAGRLNDYPVVDVVIKCGDAVALGQDGSVRVSATVTRSLNGSKKSVKLGEYVAVQGGGRIVKLAMGSSVVALDERGRIWQWGGSVTAPSDPGGMGINEVYEPTVLFKLNSVVDIYSAGASAAWTADGSVYFWKNGSGGMRTREWLDHWPSKEEWTQPEKINWTWK